MNLGEFLKPTKFCNCNRPEIKNLAFKIAKNSQTDLERAKKMFLLG